MHYLHIAKNIQFVRNQSINNFIILYYTQYERVQVNKKTNNKKRGVEWIVGAFLFNKYCNIVLVIYTKACMCKNLRERKSPLFSCSKYFSALTSTLSISSDTCFISLPSVLSHLLFFLFLIIIFPSIFPIT